MNQSHETNPRVVDETIPFDSDLHEILAADRELPLASPTLRAAMRERVQLQLALRTSAAAAAPASPVNPTASPRAAASTSHLAVALVGAVVGSVLTWAALQSSLASSIERAQSGEAERTQHAVATAVAAERAAHAAISTPAVSVATHASPPAAANPSSGARDVSPPRREPDSHQAISQPIPTSSLRQEQLLIESARDALARGHTSDALALMEQHRSRFAHGTLAEDREFILIRTLQAQGESEAAIAHAEDFLRDYPTSSYVRRLSEVIPAWRRMPAE